MNHLETTEPRPPLTKEEAEKLTRLIQAGLEEVAEMISLAWTGRADIALGYPSWSEYCKAEFSSQLAIPRSERGDFVRQLRAVGMSTRAIGSAIGVDQKTVVNDLAAEENSSAEVVVGLDRKRYKPPQPTPQEKDERAALCKSALSAFRKVRDLYDQIFPFIDDYLTSQELDEWDMILNSIKYSRSIEGDYRNV